MIFPVVMYGFKGWARNKAAVVQLLTCLWVFGTPTDCSKPGFPVLHHHPEFAKIYVRQVSNTIQQSLSLDPFSSCPQHFPTSDSFPMSQLFMGGQCIKASASASVLPVNIQGWFPLGLTDDLLASKGLSRVFSSTTIWKHQFFGTQPSLWSSFPICTWLLENPFLWLYRPL